MHVIDTSSGSPRRNERVGVVVIGRNEGERLKRCLRSLFGRVETVVYVDSGSTDDSVEFARSLGAQIIDLDASQPFTMARGRNAGWRHLAESSNPTEFVQFVDGDCEVAPHWIGHALEAMRRDNRIGVVCGRRRERFPDATLYNRLIDMEWDDEPGDVAACGGDALMRLCALQEVSGYHDSMIAGEEPEMCARMRLNGWRIVRIHAEMTLHDAALLRFSQWWTRTARGGHAYAEGAALQGRSSIRHNVRQLRSVLFWALFLPLFMVACIAAAIATPWLWLGPVIPVFLIVYLTQTWRIARGRRSRGYNGSSSWLYATTVMIGKFAQLIGILTYWKNRLLGRRTALMEYKPPEATTFLDASEKPAEWGE